MRPSKSDPTPQEIRTACRQIQAGWSDLQRRQRVCGYSPGSRRQSDRTEQHWEPPVVAVDGEMRDVLDFLAGMGVG